jgi:hypothetical protein
LPPSSDAIHPTLRPTTPHSSGCIGTDKDNPCLLKTVGSIGAAQAFEAYCTQVLRIGNLSRTSDLSPLQVVQPSYVSMPSSYYEIITYLLKS